MPRNAPRTVPQRQRISAGQTARHARDRALLAARLAEPELATLPNTQAGRALGVTRDTIRSVRLQVGLVVPSGRRPLTAEDHAEALAAAATVRATRADAPESPPHPHRTAGPSNGAAEDPAQAYVRDIREPEVSRPAAPRQREYTPAELAWLWAPEAARRRARVARAARRERQRSSKAGQPAWECLACGQVGLGETTTTDLARRLHAAGHEGPVISFGSRAADPPPCWEVTHNGLIVLCWVCVESARRAADRELRGQWACEFCPATGSAPLGVEPDGWSLVDRETGALCGDCLARFAEGA